jgi:hypothetical protein
VNSNILLYRLVVLVVLSVAFCVATVIVVRRFGAREAWTWWGIAVAAVTLLTFVRGGAWLWSLGNPIATVYMWIMIACLPTAAAVRTSLKVRRNDPEVRPLWHFVRTYGMFVLGGFIGLILGAIPDFAQLF